MKVDKKTKLTTVRLSAADHERISGLAHAARLSFSEFLRRAAAGVDIQPAPPAVPAVNRVVYADLARMAANLNQWAHHANSAGGLAGRDALALVGQLKELSREVAALRTHLIGEVV
ncbi:MAG: plasmid mobilization relaxosome protein MobC [Sulfuritalea sp.]|nr:plasmid mobilization relaxosome protein MobC [Sulfuritalea sp.]